MYIWLGLSVLHLAVLMWGLFVDGEFDQVQLLSSVVWYLMYRVEGLNRKSIELRDYSKSLAKYTQYRAENPYER